MANLTVIIFFSVTKWCKYDFLRQKLSNFCYNILLKDIKQLDKIHESRSFKRDTSLQIKMYKIIKYEYDNSNAFIKS